MFKKIFLGFIILFFVLVVVYSSNTTVVYSQGSTSGSTPSTPAESEKFEGLVSVDCAGTDPSKCTVDSLVQTAINVLQWILAVMSVAAFVYFVYGGFIFLTAAGSSQRVEKGKSILVNTVIGIILILGAFTLIRIIGNVLLQKNVQDYNRFLQEQSAPSK